MRTKKIGAFVMMAALSCALYAQKVKIGAPAPDFAVTLSESGKNVRLSDYKGRAVLLHFWATWCPPCRLELPEMDSLSKQLMGQGEDAKLSFLAVCISDTEKSRAAFMKQNGYSFPGALDARGAVAKLYGIQGIPTTILISPEGTVLDVHVGMMQKEQLDAMVKDYAE